MIIGPKYKIARRLGAPIFEKTQTQKFALRSGKKSGSKFTRPKSDFGLQMNEKQKARMFYGVTEKQFAKYVKSALSKKGAPSVNLLNELETRLDNVVWRGGLVSTHRGARQAVAHGHFTVNGKRVFVPSFKVKEGDIINIREGSRNSKLFNQTDEKLGETTPPIWIKLDSKKKEIVIQNNSVESQTETLFDLSKVIEYYQR
ncbi:MAG: 30S ribosomal protein S4 [Patescibacteria group bacterium]